MEKKELYLIDGYALIYRAYFALMKNPLTNSAGQPTGAFYGFAGYLLRLLETYKCPYLAVVMDSPRPTFRHLMYDKYKANREAMPEELKSQIPIIRRFIDACNIPTIIQEGLEADDLMASLTLSSVDSGFDVFLVTRDKDLMQLVGPHVTMLAPESGGALLPMDAAHVKNKMGVEPQRIGDYLALIGDSSDNIPGIPGVGPKTAIKILEQIDSVDALLADASPIANPKLREKIEENRDLLLLSRQLVTLKTDVPIVFTLDELARKEANCDECEKLLREMECASLLKSPLLARRAGAENIADIVVVDDDEKLDLLTRRLFAGSGAERVCSILSLCDPAASIRSRRTGIAIATDEKSGFYIPLCHESGKNLAPDKAAEFLGRLFCATNDNIRLVGHDLKQELHCAFEHGASRPGQVFDCMVADYLLDPGRRDHTLPTLVSMWLGNRCEPVESLFGSGKERCGALAVPVQKAASVVGSLACTMITLERKLRSMLHERRVLELFDSIEMPLVWVLAGLERQGVKIDCEFLEKLSVEYRERLDRIAAECYALAPEEFNINSPKQIGEILFDKLGLPAPKKTKTGAHATGIEVLEKLAEKYPIARRILDYRELQKLLSTYIDALPAQTDQASGRVHTCFNQTVTATGRLSSTDPNLQNIPVRTDDGKRIRNAFIADKGNVLVSADYSQIELRILAHLSGDPLLIHAFLEDRDIHTQTASAVYGIFPEMVTPEMRRAAKTINFGLIYGMGPIKLARQIDVSFTEARRFMEVYFRQFPTIKSYMDSSVESARRLGYAQTLLGRRRYLPDINADNRVIREAAERTAVNTPVQGSAADIIKIAMIDIDRSMPQLFPHAKMVLQVHDELVFELPAADAEKFCAWVVERMSRAYTLSVPMRVDAKIGRNWNEAH